MTSSDTDTPILVVVRPGSACGDADFNIGDVAGAEARARLVERLDSWKAGVFVIDDDLSDELPEHPALNEAITRALQRARGDGHVSVRAIAEVEELAPLIQRFVEERQHQLPNMRFEVAGAWLCEEGARGAVNMVVGVLRGLGLQADVSAAAILMDFDDDGDEYEENDQGFLVLVPSYKEKFGR